MREVSEPRRIVKARENRAPGRAVRIDLGGNRCAYGRQLLGANVEFYDRCWGTTDSDTVDLLDVVAAPVAFTVWVMKSAFRRSGGWELLDVGSGTTSTDDRTNGWSPSG